MDSLTIIQTSTSVQRGEPKKVMSKTLPVDSGSLTCMEPNVCEQIQNWVDDLKDMTEISSDTLEKDWTEVSIGISDKIFEDLGKISS